LSPWRSGRLPGLLAQLALLLPGSAAAAEDTAASFEAVEFMERPAVCQAALQPELILSEPDLPLISVAQTLAAQGLPLIFLLPGDLAQAYASQLRGAIDLGHEAGLWLDMSRTWADEEGGPVPVTRLQWWAQGRAERRALRRAAGQRPRVVGLPILSFRAEPLLVDLGFRVLLPLEPMEQAQPRRALIAPGYPSRAVIVPPLRGPQPTEAALDPAALDRLAHALELGELPIVRLTLLASQLDSDRLSLLSRWREQVLQPCQARILLASDAPNALRGKLRASSDPRTQHAPQSSSRPLDMPQLLAAASALPLAGPPGSTLPAALPGELNLTEAFLAFSLALAEPQLPERVRLGPLGPPMSSPVSVLGPAGQQLSAQAIRTTASDLAPYLKSQVPAVLRAGEHSLTAAEFLCAMAAVLMGQDRVLVLPVFSPDPYAPGLGWGASEGQ